LGKFAKACDPDFVNVPVLEYFVYCVVHGRGSSGRGRRPRISRGAIRPSYHYRAQAARTARQDFIAWCARRDSNSRPVDPEVALIR
jgi:hypothetical protein